MFHPRSTFTAVPLVLALTAGSLIPAKALAQNALGDGRGLDNNLQVGSGRINPARPSLQAELDFRNAIVTGNVGGGKQFRGDVGYSAANDFRGALGSNDIFYFQRETVNSAITTGIATRNLRGIDALRSQFDLPTAGQTQGFGGELIINRPGVGFNAQQIVAPMSQTANLDPFTRISGTLRSTSRMLSDAAIQPDVLAASHSTLQANQLNSAVGNTTTLDQRADTPKATGEVVGYLVASELHGVRSLPLGSAALGSHEQALAMSGKLDRNSKPLSPDAIKPDRLNEQPAEPRASYEEALDLLRERAKQITADKIIAPLAEPPVDGATPTDTKSVVPTTDQPGNNASEHDSSTTPKSTTNALPSLPGSSNSPLFGGSDPSGLPSSSDSSKTPGEIDRSIDPLVRLLDELRTGMEFNNPGDQTQRVKPEGPKKVMVPGTEDLAVSPEIKVKNATREVPGAIPSTTLRRAQELLGKQPYRINTYIAPQSSQEIFQEHMREGQRAMEEGRWFNAEERFTTALNIIPGDPMASIGRVNSQIAAGLVVSAGLNLRTSLRAYPELMAAQFDDKLLPRGERLDRAIARLRTRTQGEADQAHDAGLLLAYLGKQLNRQELVKEGFEVIDRVDASSGATPDPLDATLRAVWLGDIPAEEK